MKKKSIAIKCTALFICLFAVMSSFSLTSFAETVSCTRTTSSEIYDLSELGYSVVGLSSTGISSDLQFLGISICGTKVGTTNTKIALVGCSGSALYYKTITMSTYINGIYKSALSGSYSNTTSAPKGVYVLKSNAVNGSIRTNGAIVAKSSSKTYTAQANTNTYS